MIIICNKQKLQDGISICQKAITGKSTMPILEGIYINATKEGITLIGSDIDVCIETKVDADVLEEGKVVIDSKIFGEIIRKLPNSDVRIEIIQSVFNVVFMNADEFPSIPKLDIAKELKVSQSILKNMIKSTSFAIAQDETRPILQGILFEVKEKKLNLVALDGYRMAIKTEYLDNDFDIEVVIPGKTLNEVSKILEDIESIVNITFTNNHILFDLGETKIISRLLEGKYVNYLSLLPQEHKLLINVNRQELQNGIERASLMAKEGNSNLVKLEMNEESIIITSNSQLGKVREEVTANMQGDPIQIAFNSRYIIDVLKNMEDDNVQIEMTSSVSPCVIKGKEAESYKYLVLPVRLIR